MRSGAADTTTAEMPCVIYAARSQAEEPGKDSTGDQVALIRQRLEREPARVVFGDPHVDHASGYRGNRGPGLEAAIAAAERAVDEYGTAELWVWITSRLGRGTGGPGEARAVGHLLYELRAKGITVRSVEDDEFATNEMLWGFASRMASKYSEDLAANVRRGIDGNVRDGKPWGEPAYGYAKGDDGHWVVHAAEAAIAARIFRERVERGRSYLAIAKLLNAECVPTRRGAVWSATVVQRILIARTVLGEFQHRGEWHQGRHSPIVELATWEAAQALAERGRKYAPRGSGRLPKRHLLVQGMLRCVCGAAMLPRSDGDVYVCRRRKMTEGVHACAVPPLKRSAVELPMLRIFEDLALDVDATRDRLAEALDERLQAVRSQAALAAREVATKRDQAARVESDYLAGELGAATFERLSGQLSADLTAAEAEAERLQTHTADVERLGASLDAEHEVLRRLAELKVEIARQIHDAGDISAAQDDVGALRAAIGSIFESITLESFADDGQAGVGVVEDTNGYRGGHGMYAGQLYLLPHLRADVVRDFADWDDPNGSRFLNVKKVPLALEPLNQTRSGVPL